MHMAMKEKQNQFLRLLGQITHDIPVLVVARLLKAFKPFSTSNSVK